MLPQVVIQLSQEDWRGLRIGICSRKHRIAFADADGALAAMLVSQVLRVVSLGRMHVGR